jgi:folate-binding protein YgfZ
LPVDLSAIHATLHGMTAPRLFSRAIIRLSPTEEGEDVAEFLQGLVTNDVKAAMPCWAGLLSAQGKALFDFIAWSDGAAVLLDCEAAVADELVKRLSLYRLRRKIAIAIDPDLGVYWKAGDGPSPDPRLAELGQRWLAPCSDADEAADDDWLAHRLHLGVCEGRAELGNGETLWLEANAVELNGVSFTKGCYVGQENTARMNWRQKVNRRLIVVPLDRSAPARRRVAYDGLGLAIDHLRVEDIPADAWPRWLAQPAS